LSGYSSGQEKKKVVGSNEAKEERGKRGSGPHEETGYGPVKER